MESCPSANSDFVRIGFYFSHLIVWRKFVCVSLARSLARSLSMCVYLILFLIFICFLSLSLFLSCYQFHCRNVVMRAHVFVNLFCLFDLSSAICMEFLLPAIIYLFIYVFRFFLSLSVFWWTFISCGYWFVAVCIVQLIRHAWFRDAF